MTFANYVDRLCEVQEIISDYTVATLLECEAECNNIMYDAIRDTSLSDMELDELWERRENLLFEIEDKVYAIRQ